MDETLQYTNDEIEAMLSRPNVEAVVKRAASALGMPDDSMRSAVRSALGLGVLRAEPAGVRWQRINGALNRTGRDGREV